MLDYKLIELEQTALPRRVFVELKTLYTGRHNSAWSGSYEAATRCCKGSFTAERSHCICYSPTSVSPTSFLDGPSSPCPVVSRCWLLCRRRGGKVEKFRVSHGWNDDHKLNLQCNLSILFNFCKPNLVYSTNYLDKW